MPGAVIQVADAKRAGRRNSGRITDQLRPAQRAAAAG
jgi:predicted phage tail protein